MELGARVEKYGPLRCGRVFLTGLMVFNTSHIFILLLLTQLEPVKHLPAIYPRELSVT
jgi:hypothetical protein